jgi:hypothetical protein
MIPALVALSACGTDRSSETGDRRLLTETRQVAAFTTIDVANSIEVHVRVGSPASLSVTTEHDLLAKVATRVAGDRLTVAIEGNDTLGALVKVDVVSPRLADVEAGTSATVTVAGVSGSSFTATATGSATVTASGSITALGARASSSAHLNLTGLRCRTAQVDIGSSARAEIQASDSVSGRVHESGALVISGGPRNVAVEKQTSGQVSVN